ncbi:MAG TPA: ATP-dependent DNA helicase, partial [Candidatus Paceibacterota bacterium]|nr:ATP-dependent DNA helicase [Candidatus Paceibacterota bacterium]
YDPEAFARVIERELADFAKIDDLYHEKGAHKGKMKSAYKEEERRIRKRQDLLAIYEAYQAKLAENRAYDFSDMIIEVLRALRDNDDLLLSLQEEYLYFLVDEHQDTNNAQNKILELLVGFHENPNIFVVGDDKQAIYRFQGASLENFLYFKQLYPNAVFIVLEDNYRSTQAILDSAHSLIAGPKTLRANAPHESAKVGIRSFSTPDAESYFLAKDIKARLEAGTPADEIALLYRENRDAFKVIPMLEKFGVPYAVESDQDILSDDDIRKLVLLLRAINQFGDQGKFIEAMHIDFLGIDPLDIWKLSRHCYDNKIAIFALIKDRPMLRTLGLETESEIAAFYEQIAKYAIACRNMSLPEFFERVVRESGFLAYILNRPDGIEKMNKLTSLFDEVKSLVRKQVDCGLKEFFEYLDLLAEHNILLKRQAGEMPIKRVRLMTAHRSKGLEFDHVYIAGAYDGHWGNKRRSDYLPLPASIYSLSAGGSARPQAVDPNDDERRLFYVALTRARKSVTITFARSGSDGRERLPSQFLQELAAEHVEWVPAGLYEEELASQPGFVFAPSAPVSISIKNQEYIKSLFERQGLSVSALNNYLACPWKYFYVNLIRIPQAPARHQMYGTAMHGALQDFFARFKKEEPGKEFLLERFAHRLNEQPLPEPGLSENLARGQAALSGYFDAYRAAWKRDVLLEFSVPYVELAPGIRLTGKLDKVELLPDGTVNVVDYKTGKPKTRGEIEGTTKSSKGDIKRQLVFYRLLLDLFDNGRYRMSGGEIDFVEPDDKGNYRREFFEIADSEVAELIETIKKSAEEIAALAFWEGGCQEKDCEYCSLRSLVKR